MEDNDFYGMFPQVVTFNPGETTQTIYLDMMDDGMLEGTETIQLDLVTKPYEPESSLGENSSTTISILDNETSYIQFGETNYNTSEIEGNPNQLEVTLTRSGNLDIHAEVDVNLMGGDAQQYEDFYLSSPERVIFGYGEESQTILMDIHDDGEREGTESFQLEIINPYPNPEIVIGENKNSTFSIIDNDLSYIQFEQSNYGGFEKEQPQLNQAEITLVRTGNVEHYTSINLHLENGDAQEGLDFGSHFVFPQ